MEPLVNITYFGIVILLGIICSILANKLKISNVLLLIITGFILQKTQYKGNSLIAFPIVFITSLSITALAILVFNSTSRLKLKEFDNASLRAIELTTAFMIFNILVLSVFTFVLFGIKSLLLNVLFAVMMTGTSPDVVMVMAKNSNDRIIQFLKIESIINTPIMVLIPFIIFDIITGDSIVIFDRFFEQILPFLQQIISGIGAGILMGIIFFKIMRKQFDPTLSPLAIIGAALLTYALAENLGGNGVLAVTTLGIFYGSVHVMKKEKIDEFSYLFSTFLEIAVFIMVGLLIKVPITFSFFFKSMMLFIIFLIVRLIVIRLTFRDQDYTNSEKIFMTLTCPKGIATAVVVSTFYAFTVGQHNIPDLKIILDLSLVFLFYSIIVSTITIKYRSFFNRIESIN